MLTNRWKKKKEMFAEWEEREIGDPPKMQQRDPHNGVGPRGEIEQGQGGNRKNDLAATGSK